MLDLIISFFKFGLSSTFICHKMLHTTHTTEIQTKSVDNYDFVDINFSWKTMLCHSSKLNI